jgi:hypothetical protein
MYSGLNSSGSPVGTHALCTPWVRAVTPTTCLDLLPPGETVDASLSRLCHCLLFLRSNARHVARAVGGIAVASSSHASARSSGEGGIAVWLTPRFPAEEPLLEASEKAWRDESYHHAGTAVRVKWWFRIKRVGIGSPHTMV